MALEKVPKLLRHPLWAEMAEYSGRYMMLAILARWML